MHDPLVKNLRKILGSFRHKNTIPIKIAFGSVPKDGGTFTFYRNIRPELEEYGIDLRCISVGNKEAGLWDSDFDDEGCVLLAENESDVKNQAMAFVDWCAETGVDIVMGINSFAILSALPHLPEEIRVMSRCANAFDHGYQITMSGRDRLSRIIATTPRLKNDLVRLYDADEGIIELIPNGISPDKYSAAAGRPRGAEESLQIGFVGRLEHNQKGVMYLPDIVRSLDEKGVDFVFRIAGKGVHRKALEKELKGYVQEGKVRFEGPLSPESVTEFLGKTDVFVFVSRFEGCPNALLEAMMAGCVPVVFKIEGITDFIVNDGVTGHVSSMGDCRDLASGIAKLDQDRNLVKKMSDAAANDARERFSSRRAAAEYARVFKKVVKESPPEWTPLPWSEFQPDPAFANPGITRRILPGFVKRSMNNCFFHLGLTNRYYE